MYHGTAKHTSGGLTKSDLVHDDGRIKSKKKMEAGKKAYTRMMRDPVKRSKWEEQKITKET